MFFGQIAITRILFFSICDNTYTKSIRVIAKKCTCFREQKRTCFPRYPGTRIKVVKEQPQLHMTNTKVSSHVGHSCTEEIMIQQFTRKIT